MDVSRETLEAFVAELMRWNKAINLVSSGDLPHVWGRHIKDCMQLANYIEKDSVVIDVGSGGGFPGLILAILGYSVHLVEIDKRKAVFLSEMTRKFSLKAVVHNCDIKVYNGPKADVLTARGFAPLNVLIPLLRFIKPDGMGLFLKGKAYQKELEGCTQTIEVFPSEIGDGVIIKVIR